jgi:hypothetical protein
MNHKTLFAWESTGILFIIIVGTLLHFTFKWSGYWKPTALFSAVNESVWEHLKLGFWPALLFGFIEALLLHQKAHNFLFAKAVVLYLIPLGIVIFFYFYTALLGHHVLALDILIFVLSVVLAQYLSYRILLMQHTYPFLNLIAAPLIVIALLAFSRQKFLYFRTHLRETMACPNKPTNSPH